MGESAARNGEASLVRGTYTSPLLYTTHLTVEQEGYFQCIVKWEPEEKVVAEGLKRAEDGEDDPVHEPVKRWARE